MDVLNREVSETAVLEKTDFEPHTLILLENKKSHQYESSLRSINGYFEKARFRTLLIVYFSLRTSSFTDNCLLVQKTWIERLKETEDLARKREEQLKMLGLVSNTNDLKSKSMTVCEMSSCVCINGMLIFTTSVFV